MTLRTQTRPLTLRLQQRLPLTHHQVNGTYSILKCFTGCRDSVLFFTGLVPSIPEVPITTIESITIAFCLLLLLSLMLSVFCLRKMYLQGVCVTSTNWMCYRYKSCCDIKCLLPPLSQLTATVLRSKISPSGTQNISFLMGLGLNPTCSFSYEAFHLSSSMSQSRPAEDIMYFSTGDVENQVHTNKPSVILTRLY